MSCRGTRLLIVGWLATLFAASPALAADDERDTRQQATWLLKKATLIHRDGRQNLLLRSLRQLRDSKLEPLFSELVQRRHPGLKIHGILGLAELADPPRLDMTLVADVRSAAVQAQLISAAIDNDLLTAEDAKQLARWPDLPPAVEVLVAGKLIADEHKLDPAILDRALESDNLALRSTAAMLKRRLGDADAARLLDRLHGSDALERDAVRKLLLQIAMKYDMRSMGPWAMAILDEPEADRELVFQALRAALMFGTEGAPEAWRERFDAAGDFPMQLRLAVLAADVAEHVEPGLFIPLIRREESLLAALGRAGEVIAEGKTGDKATVELIRMNNVLTNRWAVKRAVDLSDGDRPASAARPILLGLIDAADQDFLDAAGERDQPRFAAQRLQSAIVATQTLHENDPASAKALGRRLADATMLQQEAILMGLIRSKGDRPDRLLADADPRYKSKTAEALGIVLRTKHAANADDLDEAAMERLSLIVRRAFPPGRGLEEPLRLQAAWTYLRLKRSAGLALAEVLGDDEAP